jgi:2-polyprenyl-6-methoxyphenol hydroxylase-like FAD-dependent oxidoreductase
MTEPVLVAGGGIGGLAVARALTRRGVPVVVFERAERPVPERGTGLTLWGNAMRVLDDLGCAAQVAKSGGLVCTREAPKSAPAARRSGTARTPTASCCGWPAVRRCAAVR